MALCKRLVARLDIKGNKLIKGVRFEGLRVVGEAITAAKYYSEQGIDEILFIDSVASLYGRNSLHEILKETTREVFVPITAGGGVRSIKDASTLLRSGADKIAVNTEALRRPELIKELAEAFGSQCVVVSIQARRTGGSNWEAMTEAGREPSGRDVLTWIKQVEELGAGEILLTSVDQDGTCKGSDQDLIQKAANIVKTPLIVGGGFTEIAELDYTFKNTIVSGISIGAAFHKTLLSIKDCKKSLTQEGNSIRIIDNNLPDIKGLDGVRAGIVDYGMGNQQSLINALEHLGCKTYLSDKWITLEKSDVLFLPGVGAFPKGIQNLKERKLFEHLINWGKSNKALIGICLGMQMLFDTSEEFGTTEGLGLISGNIKKIDTSKTDDPKYFPLPHMGWNKLTLQNKDTKYQNSSPEKYFIHSFAAQNVSKDVVRATTAYANQHIIASVQLNNLVGFQFHPERSGLSGLQLLERTILDLAKR